AAENHRTGLITLTRGEAGSLGISKAYTPSELAQKRSEELHCAAKKLEISYLKIYDLPDKNLSQTPAEAGLSIIQKEIELFNPDAIITFHENGISGHPDHKQVTQWVLTAVDSLNTPPFLFYFGILPEHARMMPKRKLFAMPESDVTHKIEVKNYFSRKKAAIACHQTQEELWKSFQDLPVSFEAFSHWEYFMQVRPLPHNREVSFELFEKISVSASSHKI
ncbi:MAG: PIG-L family deacetylase, partial [bacterium]